MHHLSLRPLLLQAEEGGRKGRREERIREEAGVQHLLRPRSTVSSQRVEELATLGHARLLSCLGL